MYNPIQDDPEVKLDRYELLRNLRNEAPGVSRPSIWAALWMLLWGVAIGVPLLRIVSSAIPWKVPAGVLVAVAVGTAVIAAAFGLGYLRTRYRRPYGLVVLAGSFAVGCGLGYELLSEASVGIVLAIVGTVFGAVDGATSLQRPAAS